MEFQVQEGLADHQTSCLIWICDYILIPKVMWAIPLTLLQLYFCQIMEFLCIVSVLCSSWYLCSYHLAPSLAHVFSHFPECCIHLFILWNFSTSSGCDHYNNKFHCIVLSLFVFQAMLVHCIQHCGHLGIIHSSLRDKLLY